MSAIPNLIAMLLCCFLGIVAFQTNNTAAIAVDFFGIGVNLMVVIIHLTKEGK